MDLAGSRDRLGGAWHRLVEFISALSRAWRRRQREVALLRELEGLDERMLKDIGFRREELLAGAREDSESRKPGPAGTRAERLMCRCRLCGAPLRGCGV